MSELIGSDRPSFDLEVNANVYSVDSCMKAAYALMSKLTAQIETEGEKIKICITPAGNFDLTETELKGLFLDEILDYSLRESIKEQTASYRDIILSNAFSNSKLIG